MDEKEAVDGPFRKKLLDGSLLITQRVNLWLAAQLYLNRLPTYLMTGRLLPAKNAQDIRYLPTYIAH